jgi:hypothetical protein
MAHLSAEEVRTKNIDVMGSQCGEPSPSQMHPRSRSRRF